MGGSYGGYSALMLTYLYPEYAYVPFLLRMQQLISVYEMDYEVVIFEDEGHAYSKKKPYSCTCKNS